MPITPEVGNVFLRDRMVGNEETSLSAKFGLPHPVPPSTIPGGFKKSEEDTQVKLDYAPNKETALKNKSLKWLKKKTGNTF